LRQWQGDRPTAAVCSRRRIYAIVFADCSLLRAILQAGLATVYPIAIEAQLATSVGAGS
jgi:hypothetical protein